MTFPVPSAKLFTTETSAIGGKVDNNAKAVVNLHITPSKERLLKNAAKKVVGKIAKKPVQTLRVSDERKPKVYSATPPQYPEESQFAPKVETNPVQYEVQEEYVQPIESTPVQYEVLQDETPVVYASTYEELAEDEQQEEDEVEEVKTETKYE